MKKTEPKKTDNVDVKTDVKKTETKNVFGTDRLTTVIVEYPNVLNTSDLSNILTDVLNVDIEPKFLRKILRKYGFNGNDIYKKYRFDKTDTVTINRIIEIVSETVNDRNRKRTDTLKRRTERRTVNETVIRYRNGNVVTEPITGTESDKTEPEPNRNNIIPDGK